MASPLTTALTPQAISPAVRKHFVDEYKNLEPKLDMVFKVDEQQVDYNELEVNYTGLSSMPTVVEGQTIPEDSPIQGYQATYTPVKYAKLIPITFEMLQWKKTADIVNAAKMAGKATARSVEKNAANVFNRGQNTSYTSLTDAVPLFSTLHTRADGGASQSNASSTGIPLTWANLETGILAAEQVLDNRGELVTEFMNTLLVPPALRRTAIEVTKSTDRPDTANRAINAQNTQYENMGVYGGGTIGKVIVWHFLGAYAGGSDTAWVLLSQGNHKITWKWAYKPTVSDRDESIGFKNDVVYFKARYGASTGWTDWLGTWRSAGANAAFSS